MLHAGSPRRLIWRHASQHLLNASLDWTSSTANNDTSSTSLEFDYRVVCTGNYHGPRCATFCRPRDDINGHYRCTQNGTRVCLDGWSDTFCTRRKLPAESAYIAKSLIHSHCSIPNTVTHFNEQRSYFTDRYLSNCTFVPYKGHQVGTLAVVACIWYSKDKTGRSARLCCIECSTSCGYNFQ